MNKFYRSFVNKLIVPLILISIPFFLPLYHFSFDVGLVLTILSLIFGVLISFFIATATTNYINLNNRLSEGNALLTIVFNYVHLLDPVEGEKIAGVIDTYLIRTVDYPIINHSQQTEKEFNDIIECINNVKIEEDNLKQVNYKRVAIVQNLQNAKADLFKVRQNIIQIVPRVISSMHWFIITSLMAVLLTLMFSLRGGGLVLSFIDGVVFACFYFLLVILHEVDSNYFLENQLAYEDIQIVFKSIGKLRYYPSFAIEDGTAKAPKETYRVGKYRNYPKSMEKQIVIIEI